VTPPNADTLSAASAAAAPRRARLPVRALLFGALGAAAGAAYAHFVGCRTGTCPLTSNVWVAAIYGAGVGAVVGWPARRPQA
jgi:hypothetical protein